MNTVIIYASKHGTTEKCARLLSGKLEGTTDLYELKTGPGPELEQYDRVIIGGSIYGGRIRKEIREFCSRKLAELQRKELGLFICSMFDESAEVQLKAAFPGELFNQAVVSANFGGELRFSKMSVGEKLLTKMVSGTIAKNNPDLAVTNMKKDKSMLMEQNIDRFAQLMNKA